MPMLFGVLSSVWKWGVLRRRGTQAGKCGEAAAAEDPRCYTVHVRRDAAALGRFVKRLSVLGAEHFQIEEAPDDVVRVRMKRPAAVTNWEATVARLMDQCGFQCAGASASDKPAR